ncbi:hypothetical protein IKD82_00885 [Candidatus Saccharibacteria bacterium]|nr:hypothetical protein [Candidatus Saccharibacteria bacterium]
MLLKHSQKSTSRIIYSYLSVALLFFMIIALIIPKQIVSALTAETLLDFSENNILFYNPENDNCDDPPTDNGIYKGAQYSFSDEELKRLWWAATNEQGNSEEGIKTELSVIANISESNGKTPGDNQGLIDCLHNNGCDFFDSRTYRAYDTGISWDGQLPNPSAEQIAIAKDILNNGNRTVPVQIVEHDMIADLTSTSNDGVEFDKNDYSQYKSGTTVIKNRYSSSYIFYIWANGEKQCSSDSCGDPFGYFESSPPEESYSTVTTTGNNSLYDGRPVLSEAQLQQVENNKSVYQKIAEKYDFPWQLLAALHYREHNFAVDNPANGEGMYQLHSLTNGGTNEHAFWPAGPVSEAEFERQTDLAAQVIRGKIGDADLNNNDDNVKRLMFMYNWANQIYVERAINMGFSEEQAKNGEGSPYVMNMYDAERDPNNAAVSPYWTGLIVSLSGNTVTDTRPGSYVVFQALGGGTGESGDDYCNPPGSNGTIADAALTLSWPGLNSHSKDDPKPEYVSAMKTANTFSNYCASSGSCAPIGASCDQFVTTVMISSGADPEFNRYNADATHDYMASHPEKYMKVDYNGSNPEILEPGDIFATYGSSGHGHIWIYVEVDGQQGRADASYNDRTAEHYVAPNPAISDYGGSRHYEVFRRLK